MALERVCHQEIGGARPQFGISAMSTAFTSALWPWGSDLLVRREEAWVSSGCSSRLASGRSSQLLSERRRR
jgi:hypothetical protein